MSVFLSCVNFATKVIKIDMKKKQNCNYVDFFNNGRYMTHL